MTSRFSISLAGLFLLSPWALDAAANLPVPLKLPPGLRQTLRINKELSYIGDAVRIVDCPKDEDNPLGTCSNLIFGGLAMWDSHLSGLVEIKFYEPINDIAHFEISHPSNLAGDNAVMKAPQGYEMRVRDMFVLDALDQVSAGDLNLLTGEVTKLNYAILPSNTWYGDLVKVNPKLKPPAFQFPGIYGSGQVRFEQRSDGLLDVTLVGSTFLPLSKDVKEEPLRIPLPYCGPLDDCFGINAPGSSLHPHIYFTTRPSPAGDCGANCPDIPFNSVQMFTAHSYFTSFGDHFTINIPELGGRGDGRTHLQGRIQLQFGPRSGDTVPVAVSTLPPMGLLADIPDPPAPLSTFKVTMFGHNEFLKFPSGLIYVTADPVLLEDAFDLGVGSLNLKTGQFIEGLVYRGVPAQSLFSVIIGLNITRIPLDTFRHRGPAYVLKGPNRETIFGYSGNYFTSFETFSFPSPNYDKPLEAKTAGAGSDLNPFLRFQAVQIADTPRALKTGSADNLLSSFNERFSYSYSISCDPSARTGQFTYTNSSSTTTAGTYQLENLAAVSCTNSKNSTASTGNYDTISFTGYGTWSRDVNDGRHLVSVHISNPPDSPPYVSIQVDGGTTSKVHTKPPEDTIP
jgi:hypothetical protein